MNFCPIDLQKGYQLCIGWQHHSTILAYSAVWSSFDFFVNSNHSHNGNMAKDKHAKVLDFMLDMKFGDNCIGFAAETKKCSCLGQFLGEEITPSDGKDFFASISYDQWNGISEDDDEEMKKENVIAFLNPIHVVKNAKEFF